MSSMAYVGVLLRDQTCQPYSPELRSVVIEVPDSQTSNRLSLESTIGYRVDILHNIMVDYIAVVWHRCN